MIAIFAAIMIFGAVHPGAKLLLGTGIPLSYFCLLYVLIRLVCQLPLVLTSGEMMGSWKRLGALALLGLTGTLLQFFEFKALDVGMSPATVTFLMFSYPVWMAIFGLMRGTEGASTLLRTGLVLTGMLLVTHASIGELGGFEVLYPILAGISIALWTVISNRLRSAGAGAVLISFYYDLFALCGLLFLFAAKVSEDWQVFYWWISFEHLAGMAAYSILIGLLPNLLFYRGNRDVSTVNVAIMATLEPVFSTLYTGAIWGFTMSAAFWWGAALILFSNLPVRAWILAWR